MLGNNILVIGDLMIDEWTYGYVEKLSPEAPIPVVDVESSQIALGGAGNVLVNLKAMDCKPIIISGISSGTIDGQTVKRLVSEVCDKTYYFDIPESLKKQRICGSNQQIVRIDTGRGSDIPDLELDRYLEKLEGDDINAVLIADYGKGAVTDTVLKEVSDFCYREKIPMLIDPYRNMPYYDKDFYCKMIKLNKNEAENFTGESINDLDDIKRIGDLLMDKFCTESILITLGPDGMAYFDKKAYRKNPFRVIDNPLYVYDVCGAGDVVFAVLGKLMAEGYQDIYDIETVIRYAAKAGRLAVSKKGTSVVEYSEIF